MKKQRKKLCTKEGRMWSRKKSIALEKKPQHIENERMGVGTAKMAQLSNLQKIRQY